MQTHTEKWHVTFVFHAAFGAFPHRIQAAAVNRLATDARILSEASERATWWHEDCCLASAQKTTRDGLSGVVDRPHWAIGCDE